MVSIAGLNSSPDSTASHTSSAQSKLSSGNSKTGMITISKSYIGSVIHLENMKYIYFKKALTWAGYKIDSMIRAFEAILTCDDCCWKKQDVKEKQI